MISKQILFLIALFSNHTIIYNIITMLLKWFVFSFFIWTVHSCSVTKHIPEKKYLLDKIIIKSDIPEYTTTKLKSYIRQHPNYKMFGIFKTKLYIHELSWINNGNWINRLICKLGEPPVIFESTLVKKTEIELKKILIKIGYLHPIIFSKVFFHNKKANVIYYIYGNTPYYINNYNICIKDSLIKKELQEKIKNENPSLHTSLIKPGMLFDLNLLNKERERITILLQNRGYFKFSKENIVYTADSTFNKINLKLKFDFSKKNYANANKKFYYDSVFIYTDYNPFKINNLNIYPQKDSIVYNAYTIYTNNKFRLNLKMLLSNCFIVPSNSYSLLKKEITYTSLMSLHSLKNIRIQLYEKIRNDSTLLDCHIFTMPIHPQTISFSIEGTNTSGDFGITSSLNYIHRNLFHQSEILNFRLQETYKFTNEFFKPYLELEGTVSLHVPKFIFDIINISPFNYRASTNIFINYNYLLQPKYQHVLWSSAIQLQWEKRANSTINQSLNLLNIEYFPYKNENLLKEFPVSIKYPNYVDQFIAIGTNYSYNNFYSNFSGKNIYKFKLFTETVGNTFFLLKLFLNKKQMNIIRPFAQFSKIEMNFSKNKKINPYNAFAYYIETGIAVPYGNSQILPFEKKYYSGGSNSVRAWKSRELGPGSFSSNSASIYHRTGDIKLDLKMEYRINLFWKLELASFIDAGNIWTIKKYPKQKDGAFFFHSFFKQIAVGYGLGLRLNFDYFILRLDGAEKAYDPAKLQNHPLVLFHPNFQNNFTWHFTIESPF